MNKPELREWVMGPWYPVRVPVFRTARALERAWDDYVESLEPELTIKHFKVTFDDGSYSYEFVEREEKQMWYKDYEGEEWPTKWYYGKRWTYEGELSSSPAALVRNWYTQPDVVALVGKATIEEVDKSKSDDIIAHLPIK